MVSPMKKKKAEYELLYQECVDTIFSVNARIQNILIPKVFSNPITSIDKELLSTNQDIFLSDTKKIAESYKAFLKIYTAEYKQKKFSDEIITFYNRLDGVMPSFERTVKEVSFVLKHYVLMKKKIEAVKLTREPNMYPLSFIPTFRSILATTIRNSETQLGSLFQAVQRGVTLELDTYKRLDKLYLSNLELDRVNRQQLDFWKKQELTTAEKKLLRELDALVLYVHQMNGDILMSVRMLKNNLMERTSMMNLYLSALHDKLYFLQTCMEGRLY